MWKPIIPSLIVSLACVVAATGDAPAMRRAAAEDTARPANQLAVAGNACGPAALLNAMRFGGGSWQAAAEAIEGDNDRQQLFTIIRRHGTRPSPHLGGRPRWSQRGISVADLHDVANEIATTHRLPALRQDILIAGTGENPRRLLARSHKQITSSITRGFPPVLSIRRFALRENPAGQPEWTVIDAHFVTIIAAERRLPWRADSFAVEYIDPWGAHRRDGRIAIPAQPLLAPEGTPPPCLEAVFPEAIVGRDRVRRGERTAITASAVIGRW